MVDSDADFHTEHDLMKNDELVSKSAHFDKRQRDASLEFINNIKYNGDQGKR